MTNTRRVALQAIVGTMASALLPDLSQAGVRAFASLQKVGSPLDLKVLSLPQHAALDALVEVILPSDDRSPGASAARVAEYVDLLLHESDDEVTLQWLGGLAALDDEGRRRFGKPFANLAEKEKGVLVEEMSRNEKDPQTPLEAFFRMTKHATIRGYYTSEIGIHQELRYKGNRALREFVGCDTENGHDCPHCGQKA